MTTRRDFLKMGGLAAAGVLAGGSALAAPKPVMRKGAPSIKVGCAAYSYRKYLQSEKSMTLEQFVDAAAEMGCDGVELTSYYFPPDPSIDYINRLKRQVFLLGMDVCGTSVGNSFTLPPGAKRDEQVEKVNAWVRHAAEMGAPCIRIFGGGAPKDATEDQAIGWIVECIKACAPAAEQNGVILAVENHGGIPCTAEQVIRILDAAGSEWVGLNLDSGNYRSKDPYDDIARTAKYAVTTHFKTMVSPTGAPKQQADLKRIVKILKNAGFRGYLTLEYEGAEEPKVAVPRIIKAMREAVEE